MRLSKILSGTLMWLCIGLSSTSHGQSFNCGTNIIPAAQCVGLRDIYNDLGGDNWSDNSNWGNGDPNSWYGVFTIASGPGTAEPYVVSAINLDNNNLVGSLPSAVAYLEDLNQLNLSGNQISGPLPSGFANMRKLVRLYLANNQLSGGIPDAFSGWDDIRLISFANNPNLGGNLPPTLLSRSSLETLHLNNAGLSGPLPSALGSFGSATSGGNQTTLNLQNNNFSGLIPSSFGDDPASPSYVNMMNNQLDADSQGVAITSHPALQAWLAGGSTRNLSGQRLAASTTPGNGAQAVPASPMWALALLLPGFLLLARRRRA
ncbi:MAG: hypothetical protein OIF35_08690 [Cellvibrionaceae bacterium]|nr:hypothetical protein [Cellvibrionaceae bacterium]